jgi:hypothetical protein
VIGASKIARDITARKHAEATSHAAFSKNQAGRRKVRGSESADSASSIIVRCDRRLSRVASAPMVDKQSTLRGAAAFSAATIASMTFRAAREQREGGQDESVRPLRS